MKNMYLKYAMLGLTIVSTVANAQNQTLAIARTGAGTGSILGAPGDYQIQTYDRNVLENITGKVMVDRQNEDKQFVLDAVRRVEIQLQSLVDELNKKGGLIALANKSISGGVVGVQLIDYLGVTQELNAKINSVDVQINGLFQLPGALKSQENMTIKGDVSTVIPAPLKVELTKIQEFFNAQKNQILSQAASLKFLIVLPNKSVQEVNGYAYRPTTQMYTAEQLDQLRTDAIRDAMIPTTVEQRIDELNLMTLGDLRQLRKTFGSSQTYRFQLNKQGREVNLERLADIFLARNYLRAVYGTQLGVIAINWEGMIANLDVIFRGNESILSQFYGEFVRGETELMEQQNNIKNTYVTAQMRNEEVFGSGVDLLDRVMSAYTFVVGQVQLAAINAYILDLMLKDVEFEFMLTKPGGLKQVREEYRKLYYKNPAMEAAVKAKAATFVPDLNSTDVEQDVMAFNTKPTFKGALFVASQTLEGVLDRSEQARARLQAIEALRKDSGENQRAKQRRQSL